MSAHVLPDDAGTVELVGMWSAPEHRRSGLGAALVEAVVEWSRSIGARRVVLWVMRSNDSAATFYEAVGFVRTDQIAASESDPCRNEQRMVRMLS